MKSLLVVFASLLLLLSGANGAANAPESIPAFVTEISKFPALEQAQGFDSVAEKLMFRAGQQPFLLVATVIFVMAIIHTFFAIPITKLSHQAQRSHEAAAFPR